MKAVLLLLLLAGPLAVYSQSGDPVYYLEVFPGDPPCVDSLNLNDKYYYSCKHEVAYAINVEMAGDTIIVHEFNHDYHDSLAVEREVERMVFLPEDSNIRLFAIQHNREGKFRNDLDKYREGKLFRRR